MRGLIGSRVVLKGLLALACLLPGDAPRAAIGTDGASPDGLPVSIAAGRADRSLAQGLAMGAGVGLGLGFRHRMRRRIGDGGANR